MSIPMLCTSQTRQSTCNIRHAVGLERVWVEGIPLMNCPLSLMCKCGGHLGRIRSENEAATRNVWQTVHSDKFKRLQGEIDGHSFPVYYVCIGWDGGIETPVGERDVKGW